MIKGMFKKFNNTKINALVELIKDGDERAAIEFYRIFNSFINGIVNKYSKKTAIKDDADLKSYICIAYYYAALNFNPKKGTQFKNYAYFWVKKVIFSEEQEFRMIKLPVNQKVYYSSIINKIKDSALRHEDYKLSEKEENVIDRVNSSNVTNFSSLMPDNSLDSMDSIACKKLNIQVENTVIHEADNEKLKRNINIVLANFDSQEKLIIEHTFGLNNKNILSTEDLSYLLNISVPTLLTKKNRVIKLMRHKSLTDYLIN